jgi:hypothetical protein
MFNISQYVLLNFRAPQIYINIMNSTLTFKIFLILSQKIEKISNKIEKIGYFRALL